MNNKKLKISIRQDFTDKASKSELSRTGSGWLNVELSLDDFVVHITSGYPFTHQFFDGKKTKAQFCRTDILVADIDEGLSVDQALEHKFVQEYAALIYTTPRHTDEHHRFRIVFVLDRTIFTPDIYEAMYEGLMTKLPQTDPNVRSAAQFFQGSVGAKVWRLNKTLPDAEINKLTAKGMQSDINKHTPLPLEKLTPQTLVRVKNKGLHELRTLPEKTSIHCPFGTHEDKSPSAFVVVSKQGVRGVHCRSCGEQQWSQASLIDDQFGFFDQLVKDLAGKENSHFPYQGLTRFDHTLETSMGKSNFHLMNSQHIELNEILPGVHLIKSPKGTGKTVLMSRIVDQIKNPIIRKKLGLSKDDQGRTILIGHRQTLIRESAEKLGLECYLDTSGYDTQTIPKGKLDSKGSLRMVATHTKKPQHYAICLDSLSSRIRPAYEEYDVVIIDEAEQVFSHFLSEHMSHPAANFDILSKIMKRAKVVFLLDADLDKITLTGVLSCLSTPRDGRNDAYKDSKKHSFQNLYCYLNTYTAPRRVLELYTSKNHLQADLEKDIREGKRCFVTSNSKKFVEGLHSSFSKVFPDKSFELVISDRGDDKSVRYFLKNITVEILKKDVLLSSPSIGTGIDITFPENATKIDAVYGFFEPNVNTHFDIDQQLGRVRHPGHVRVWISPTRRRATTSIDKIRKEILFDNPVNGIQYYLDREGAHASQGEHPFIDLLATVHSVRRQSMNRLQDNFIAHKKKTGWDIDYVTHNEIAAQKGKVIGKASRVTRARDVRARLLNAPDLTQIEKMKLEEMKEKSLPTTDEQKAALDKYWIGKFYQEQVTEQLLEFDEEGETRNSIILLEKVIDPKNKLITYLEIDKDIGKVVETGMKPDDLRQPVLIREILAAAGLFDQSRLCLLPERTYSTDSLAGFVQLLQSEKMRGHFEHVFEKPVNDNLEEKPVTQLRFILRKIGLAQKLIKPNKGRGTSVYQIDLDRYQKLMEITQKRSGQRYQKEAKGE